MVNVAIVGYRYLQFSRTEDLAILIPRDFEGFRGLHFCYQGIIEDNINKSISDLVDEMLSTKPDVLHYANYRDPYTNKKRDEKYIREVKKKSNLPILLTSGGGSQAKEFADSIGIEFLATPFGLREYLDKIYGLANKKA